MKKRALVIMMAAAMAMTFAFSACSKSQSAGDTQVDTETAVESPAESSADPEPVGMANPNLYDVGYDEAAKIIGIDAPEGSENVVYNIIGYESERPIVEMQFDLDGITYYERVQPSGLLSLNPAAEDPDSSVTELMDSLASIPDNTDVNISGIYANFDTYATTVVGYCDGAAFGSDEGSFVVWIDRVPGLLYNLCTTDKVDLIELQELADQIFVSVQGDN